MNLTAALKNKSKESLTDIDMVLIVEKAIVYLELLS